MEKLRTICFAVALCFSAVCGKPAVADVFSGKGVVALPRGVWRGVCFAHSWERGGELGYGSEASFEALSHLKKQGVDYVSITPFGFMDSLNSPEVLGVHNSSFRFSETDRRVSDVTAQAKQLGMRVMLKPHIWINRGKWRGEIVPKNGQETVWDSWWDSYREWIMHYAGLAEKLNTESFVIGVEMDSAVKSRPDRLIELARAVRRVYKGHITYSANWNEAVPLEVWKELSSVSVQFYPPLVLKNQTPTAAVMRKNLNNYLDYWANIANTVSRPLVITEYGFRSGEGAALYPHAWPERKSGELPDEALQARLYQIFFEEFSKRDEVRGVFLWKYFTNKNTGEEGPTGFNPRGKPAEKIIRAFYQGQEPGSGSAVR